jgi:hypothetical protein
VQYYEKFLNTQQKSYKHFFVNNNYTLKSISYRFYIYLSASMEFINKNELQIKFNEIRGTISELNDSGDFCSVTLNCGHENVRPVNLATRRIEFEKIVQAHRIGQKVVCRFYLASNKKFDRWYTSAILLSINHDI